MKIFTPLLCNLLAYAEYQNICANTLKEIVSRSGIRMDKEEGMIDAEAYLIVLEKIIEVSKSEHSGLYIGAYLNLKALGLVLEISMNTSSIEHGVIILQRFLKEKFPLVSASIIKDSEHYIIQLESMVKNNLLRKHLLDMVLCIVYRELNLMLPSKYPLQIRLPYNHINPYKDLLKVKVDRYPAYQILMPLEVIQAEINMKKIREIELLLPKYISMLDQSDKSTHTFSSQMRSMILNMCTPEIPSFQEVQRQFFYSKRTIQRKLKEEKMSFRAIVNSIKQELAMYLSYEKHLKTKDIAFILGYSDSSAYLHAAKKWRKQS